MLVVSLVLNCPCGNARNLDDVCQIQRMGWLYPHHSVHQKIHSCRILRARGKLTTPLTIVFSEEEMSRGESSHFGVTFDFLLLAGYVDGY